ncbi:MAG: hypothetical protein IIB39_04070 [Candidatus Marinimicrobia bacterium]|nr:hypothetical protein [Candidatus Neomarinimicrobiota bacterium]
MKRFFSTLIITLLLYSHSAAQSTDIDPNHWGYDYLDLLSARGMIDGFSSGLKPVTRERFGELLMMAEEKQTKNPELLSHTEQKILQRLKGDILSDPDSPETKVLDEFRERHLFTWSEDESWFSIDAFFNQENDLGFLDDNREEQNISRTTGGARIRGYLGSNLYFYLWFTNTLEKGGVLAQNNFDPSQGLPAVAYDGNLYRDDAISYFKYRAPWFDITVGRQNITWGPGRRSGLTFSSNNPPMDVIRLDVRYRKLSYSGFIGDIRGRGGNKKIAAHRLDIIPITGLRIGAGETVVYNRSKFEILYSLPLMPFHIAEHHLGDRDNNSINFDITYDRLSNTSVYAELFIDDYKLLKNPFTHWGNKWAVLSGVLFTKPLNMKNSTLRIEYSRIEPYVYTHVRSGNEYFNYDRPMGHWAGPDSDELFLSYVNTLDWRVKLKLSFAMLRRGQLDDTFSRPVTGDLKEFLSGVVERRLTFTAGYSVEFAKDQYFQAEFQRMNWNNFGKQEGVVVFDNRFYFTYRIDI